MVGVYDGTGISVIDASVSGNCSLSFIAGYNADYLIVINEVGICGGANNGTDNGLLSIQCTGSASCTAAALSCTAQGTNVFNGSDGTATVTPLGGQGVYTYLWSDGSTTEMITGLSTGSYSVTVTDSQDNTTTCSVEIYNPLNCTVQGTDTTNGSDGMATANVVGGDGQYSYNWGNGETTQTIMNLVPGYYEVTVYDGQSPNESTACGVNIYDELSCTVEGTDTTNGTDGTATVTAFGGAGHYSYIWNNGETTQTITDLVAGTYTVTVADGQGDPTECSTTISDPPPPPANDDPAGAILLSLGWFDCNAQVSSSNIAATDSEFDHNTGCEYYGGGNDVWFGFFAPPSGELTIQTSNREVIDDIAIVYDINGTAIACDSGDGDTNISLTDLTPGDQYFIAIYSFQTTSTGTFDICAFDPVGPICNSTYDFTVPAEVCVGGDILFEVDQDCVVETNVYDFGNGVGNDPAIALNIFVYLDGGGFPGEAPDQFSVVPQSTDGDLSAVNPNLFYLGTAGTPGHLGIAGCGDFTLNGDWYLPGSCDPVSVSFFIVPFTFNYDLDGNELFGVYIADDISGACPVLRYDVTIIPVFEVIEDFSNGCEPIARFFPTDGNGNILDNNGDGQLTNDDFCGSTRIVDCIQSGQYDFSTFGINTTCSGPLNGTLVCDCIDPCEEDIILVDPDDNYNGGTFIAATDKSIIASNKITGVTSVEYSAGSNTTNPGESISLMPGFEVGADSDFHAYLEGCGPILNLNNENNTNYSHINNNNIKRERAGVSPKFKMNVPTRKTLHKNVKIKLTDIKTDRFE